MRWVFSVGGTLEDASFDDCCIALQCRPWVLRLRVHLEFWRKDLRLQTKVPGLMVPLPHFVLEEGFSIAGDAGVNMLHRIWEWPGISAARLRDLDTVGELEEKGLVVSSYNGSFYYCVGRSPLNRYGRPRVQSWSSFWRDRV